jgi:hypothetical protein
MTKPHQDRIRFWLRRNDREFAERPGELGPRLSTDLFVGDIARRCVGKDPFAAGAPPRCGSEASRSSALR